ncbi:putative ribonuclease H-like domain-containing protein, partial [Tanacetum coccineum]
MRIKPGVDSLRFDDLYNNLRVFESDVKGSTASSSSTQNVAFVLENTNSTNDDKDNGRRSGKQEDFKALVTIDGEGVDWTSHSEKEEDYALMACNCSSSDTEVTSYSKECKESYAKLKKLYDEQRAQLSDASIEIQAYTQDLDDKTDVLTYHKKLLAEAQKEKEDLKAKVEKWHNSSKNLGKLLNTRMSAHDKFGLGYKDYRYDGILSYENEVLQSVFMNKERNYMPSGPDIEIDYSQFTYGPKHSQPSESKTQTSEFDTCESNISEETPELVSKPVVNEPNVVCQPKVWSDAPIIEESVLTRTGKILVNTARASGTNNVSTAKHNFNRHAVPSNAARKVNIVKPMVNAVNAIGGKGKLMLSPQQVVIGDQKDITGTKHINGNKAYLAEYQDFNGGLVAFGGSKGYITSKGKIKIGKLDFEDVCFLKELQHFNLFYVSQMCDKKKKVLFTDTERLVLSSEFKLPDENQIMLKIPRQNNMYGFILENSVPSGGLACLIAKVIIDESNKWHRRLGHVNFKNLNKLMNGNLVRGLPSKIFQNDHTCVACQKGKQHKASCKAKIVSSISQPLQLLHMDLFGPTSVRSLNHKTYCLVITDDFS